MIFNPTGKEKYRMTDSKVIYKYLHGGKGVVTLVNPNSLKCHTYKFLKPMNERDFPEDTIFVYVVHDKKTFYLGVLSGSELRRTRRSSFAEETEAMKGARYIVKMSLRQDLVDSMKMHIYHNGRCCICGRRLNSDKALAMGIGRKCNDYYELKLNKVPWDGN